MKEIYDKYDDECVITDALHFISDKASHVISDGHVFVYRHFPKLFGKGYLYTERHEKLFRERSALYDFFSKGADELSAFIKKESYDTVICTHPFAALMLTEVQKRYHLNIKTAFVATDYICSPSVKDGCLDYYFIPHKSLAKEFVCSNVTKDKLIVSGIPVRQMFYTSTDKATARHKLGIKKNHKHLVMMCGSMGCGPIEKLAELLSGNKNIEVSVICGTNKKLYRELQRKLGDKENLHIRGYVKNISLMLDSADLYLTKPGGISTTEAVVKKVPMALINTVGGCEEYNSRFFISNGMAISADKADALVSACLELLRSKEKYQKIKKTLELAESANSAELIRRVLCR